MIVGGWPSSKRGQRETQALPNEGRQIQIDGMAAALVLFHPLPVSARGSIGGQIIQPEGDVTAPAIFTADHCLEAIPGLDGEGGIDTLNIAINLVLWNSHKPRSANQGVFHTRRGHCS